MTKLFDPCAPAALVNIQKWFASIITQRMTEDNQIQELSIRSTRIAEEALDYVTKSPTLEAHERMEIYCKSYWARLLDTLMDAYPLVSSLFGRFEFCQLLAIPYFVAQPVEHWDLNILGTNFVDFLETGYQAKDRELVLNSARLDWAMQECFFTKAQPHFTGGEKIGLQPHLYLFELPYDLLSWRKAFLQEDQKDIDYWLDHPFPKLIKDNPPYHFVIYRSAELVISWQDITASEYLLLKQLKAGKSIHEACAELEAVDPDAHEHIAGWIERWIACGWLSSPLK